MDISTQGEMPFPLERGVSLAPGYATMIGLRKVTNTTEATPFPPLYLRLGCSHNKTLVFSIKSRVLLPPSFI